MKQTPRWYERDVRVMAFIRRVLVRRGSLPGVQCDASLLPGFVTWGGLDAAEVIGPALEAMCGGAGIDLAESIAYLRHHLSIVGDPTR